MRLPVSVASLLAAACAPPAVPASLAAAGVDGGREPDGVFFDVPTARPEPKAATSAGGTIALAPPVTSEEVQTLLHGYFRVFSTGDTSALPSLLTHGARRVQDSTLVDLSVAIDRRIHAVDTSHVPFELVAAYDRAEVVPYEAATPSMRAALAMEAGDAWVEVPILVQFDAGVRVFGPEVTFTLRRSPGAGWRIANVREERGPWT